jgi:hypothetical protein
MRGPAAVGLGKENRILTPNFQIQRYLWLAQAPSHLLQALYIKHTPLFPVYVEDRATKETLPTFEIKKWYHTHSTLNACKRMYIRLNSYVRLK